MSQSRLLHHVRYNMPVMTLYEIVHEITTRLQDPLEVQATLNRCPYLWNPLSLADGYPGLLLFLSSLKKIEIDFELYRTHFKNWNFGCAKASGFDDRTPPHISNMGRGAIVEPRELSRRPKSNFSSAFGISEEVEHHYVLKIKELLESEGCHSLSLFSGLAGICFSIDKASHGGTRYQRMLETLHSLLISQVETACLQPIRSNLSHGTPSSSSLYDLIQGICGIGRYALEHLQLPHFRELIEKIIHTLIELCSPITVMGHSVPGWYLPPTDILNRKDQFGCPKGNFNLGLSHGVTGILAFLSIAYQKGVELDRQKETIKEIASWIQSKAFRKNSTIRWPTTVSWEEEVENKGTPYEINSQDAWCYGVPGISRTLLLAGKALNDPTLTDFALTAFRGIFSRSQEKWNLPGPALCHGLSGLLLLTHEMSKEEGCSDLNYWVNALRDTLLSTYHPDAPFGFRDIELNLQQEPVAVDKPGLLEGTAGILLTLISISNPHLNWHLPLMIST